MKINYQPYQFDASELPSVDMMVYNLTDGRPGEISKVENSSIEVCMTYYFLNLVKQLDEQKRILSRLQNAKH